jgi:hypothetical protein
MEAPLAGLYQGHSSDHAYESRHQIEGRTNIAELLRYSTRIT